MNIKPTDFNFVVSSEELHIRRKAKIVLAHVLRELAHKYSLSNNKFVYNEEIVIDIPLPFFPQIEGRGETWCEKETVDLILELVSRKLRREGWQCVASAYTRICTTEVHRADITLFVPLFELGDDHRYE